MLVAGRVIAGIAVGIASSVVPIYQSEITPPAIRGRLVSMQQWYVRCSHHSQLDSTRACQVDHLGYSPPVLCRVRLLVHQRHGVLPHSLGPADDSCHHTESRHARLPGGMFFPQSACSRANETVLNRVPVGSLTTTARTRRSRFSQIFTARATRTLSSSSSSSPRSRSRSASSAPRARSRTGTSSSLVSSAASVSARACRCGVSCRA